MLSNHFSVPNCALALAIQTVLQTGDPVVLSASVDFGGLEETINASRAHGLRLAGVPRGAITILPDVPVSEDELLAICTNYCRAESDGERAEQRRQMYERAYLPFNNDRAMYHPGHYIAKIAHLCSTVCAATESELQLLYEVSPYLHISPVKEVCRALRKSSAVAGEGAVFNGSSIIAPYQREKYSTALSTFSRTGAGLVSPFGLGTAATPANEYVVTHQDLFSMDAVGSAPSDEVLEDLTGMEKVDETPSDTAIYYAEKEFDIVAEATTIVDGDGKGTRILARFCPAGVSKQLCADAACALEPAATLKNLRAATNGGMPPNTGIVGYYDYLNNPTPHKCRQTAFMRDHFLDVMNGSKNFLTALDWLYREVAPEQYRLQRAAIPSRFQLFGTVFSTVTVNRNFRTAAHTDKGDFRGGLGVLCVINGAFEGCHLGIKKLGKAFKMGIGDVLFFDTSLEHGNTEVHSAFFQRTSVVCYLRTNLMSSVCEMERRKHINMLVMQKLQANRITNPVVNINGVGEATVAGQELPELYIPVSLGKELAPVQLAALGFATDRAGRDSGCVLAMTMGLGKTLVALALCFSHMYQFPRRDVLILTPKPIIGHWIDEIKKWEKYGLEFRNVIASSGTDGNQHKEKITEYAQQLEMQRRGYLFVLNPEYFDSFQAQFKKFHPMLIVVDEGHSMGSKGNRVADRLKKLNCNRRFVLSGTPVQNDADELYRLIEWVYPSVCELLPSHRFQVLATDISRYIKGDDSAFPAAVAAQQFIQEWMQSFVFSEMETNLPPLHDYLLICGSSNSQKRIIETAGLAHAGMHGANEHRPAHLTTHPLCYYGFITGSYQDSSSNEIQQRKRLRRSISFSTVAPHPYTSDIGSEGDSLMSPPSTPLLPHSFASTQRAMPTDEEKQEIKTFYDQVRKGHLRDFAAFSGKLTTLLHIVRHAARLDEKIIIFSQYVGVQDFIHRVLTSEGFIVSTVRGRDALDRRLNTMKQFTRVSAVRALVLSTKVASQGLDFTAANHVVLFDSWWNPQVDAQAVARAHRRNQRRPVIVYRLTSELEDGSILKAQMRKNALFRCIMLGQASRSARPEELQDCAECEEDEGRYRLWSALKTAKLEGGSAGLINLYRYGDTVVRQDGKGEMEETHVEPSAAISGGEDEKKAKGGKR